jgi:pilus assembly protein CpaB
MKRVIAVVVAIVMASLGTFLLVRYVEGAEDRELEGLETVDVLVVQTPIPAGTRLADVPGSLVLETLPVKATAVGAFSQRSDLNGLVAAIGLVPGEQLIVDRVMVEEEYWAQFQEVALVEIPADLLEITVALDPQRILGGELSPGERVAIFATFDPFPLNFVEPSELDEDEIPVIVTQILEQGNTEDTTAGAQTPSSTKIILHNVLVSRNQVENLPRTFDESEEPVTDPPDLAPTGNLLVSLALDPVSAERLVFTAEFGRIWLAREGTDVDTSDTQVQTRNRVYVAE